MSTRQAVRREIRAGRSIRRAASSAAMLLLPLERRLLMCAVLHEHDANVAPDVGTHFDPPAMAAEAATASELDVSSATYSANGLPELNSNPGAFAKLFLDFDGGIWSDTGYRPYAIDGDDTTFNATEQASIIEQWQRVSEAFAPFNLNVTTVDPGNLNDRETGTIIVAGNAGGGGYGIVGGFYNAGENKGITFTSPSTNAKTAAYIHIHEAGHVLGLWHQSLYNAQGQKLQEYYTGNSLIAPIMGSAYHPQRAIWWNGTSSQSPNIIQDDLAILSGGNNAFGYRSDDHGGEFSLSTPLASGSVSSSGIIERMSDWDVFSFSAGAGTISVAATVAALSPTLDVRLDLYEWDGSGYSSVASASTTAISESLSFATDGGLFALAVRSQGAYGDVGTYTLSGNVPAFTYGLDAPTNVTATAFSASQVALSWADESEGESGFRVLRSSDGETWEDLGVAAAGATSFTDTTAAGGQIYYYTVTAEGIDGDSVASQPARAVTLAGPSNLTVGTILPTKVTLTWTDDVTGETGFLIEKSTDGGATWTAAAAASPNSTSVTVPSLAVSTAYQFRVRANFDGVGHGLPSNSAGATTAFGTPPDAPSALNIAPSGPFTFILSWTNVADETGYILERSTDGTNWQHLRRLYANGTIHYDNHNAPATTFHYRVRAFNDVGSSGYSPVASATSENVTIPAAPTGLRSMNIQGNTGYLTWNDNSNSEQGFQIEWEMWDPINEEWAFENAVQQTSSWYSLQNLQFNSSYRFRVYAFNQLGYSAPTNDWIVNTGPTQPAGFSAARNNATTISMSWGNVAGESSFLVQRSAGTPWDFTTIATLSADVLNYIDNAAQEYESWTYRVIAVNSTGAQSVPSTSTTIATTHEPQSAPANVTAVASGKGIAIRVAWDDTVGESGFRIERSLDGVSGWTSLGQNSGNWTKWDDWEVGLGTTYYYRAIAHNSVGESAASAVVSATPQPTELPDAPQNLRAVSAGTQEITLTWDADPNQVYGFFLERFYPELNSWVEIYDFDDPENPVLTDFNGLSAGTIYNYRLRGYNSAGYSDYSEVLTTSTVTVAPTGLAVTSATSAGVSLSWNDVDGEESYTIERTLNGANNWSVVGTTALDVTTFTDTSVTAGTTYQYRVRTTNLGGTSAPSATATAFVPGAVPATPTGLAVTGVQANRVDLRWNDVANETIYRVQRSTDGVNFSQIGTTGANVTTFADTTAAAGTSYHYRVVAVNGNGASAPSASVSTTTIPAAPSLTATAFSATQINLSWTNVAGETGYVIERSPNGSNGWAQIGTTAANVTTFQDAGLLFGTTYWYRVRAINGSGASANSNIASATTPIAPPAAPGNLVATALSQTQIRLTWADVHGETQYVIERSTNGTTGWAQVGTTTANTTTFTNTGLKKNTRYYYRVRAVNTAGNSPYSNIANAVTLR